MNWSSVCEAIRLVIATASGLTDQELNPGYPIRRVEWANRKSAVQLASGPRARLTLRSLRGKGVDETRTEYDDGTDTLTVNQAGVRLFTVSVRVESNSQEPGADAVTYTSQLRTRLRRASALETLRLAGVALVTIERDILADVKDADGRYVSTVILDIAFCAAENDADDTAGAGDFIEKVTGAGVSGEDLAGVVLDVDSTP